jgi:hypothetical protein
MSQGQRAKSASDFPPSIANWIAFENKRPRIVAQEFPLLTDARITGQEQIGPYLFINTVAFTPHRVVPGIVLRYPIHLEWQPVDFTKTSAELYHGGSPSEELAALGSLLMGIRLRAGRCTRQFELLGDPLGTPTEIGDQVAPYFYPPVEYRLPWAVEGTHPLSDLQRLKLLPTISKPAAQAIVRAARLYQDALWLAESAPELTWLLLVSALETAAEQWDDEVVDDELRLQRWDPELHNCLRELPDKTQLPRISSKLRQTTGATRKFLGFAMKFIPEAPRLRPPEEWAQIPWNEASLKDALKIIYDYRSQALHNGRPFPAPMCDAPSRIDHNWEAPAERMTAKATHQRGGTWKQDDVPMYLHVFEHFARNTLLKWWDSCAQPAG